MQECQAINDIFYTVYTCKNIDQIEKVSKKLLAIQSEKLQFMLFEQLKITAYRFWFELKWNEKDQTVSFIKTNKIIVHPHYFFSQINGKLINDIDEFDSIMMSNGRYRIFEKILGEEANSFLIYSDCMRNYILNTLVPFLL